MRYISQANLIPNDLVSSLAAVGCLVAGRVNKGVNVG